MRFTPDSTICTALLCLKWGAPHFRHTKAMHLLQAGVNLIYIRDILGHVDVTTTETYVRADDEMKRLALQKSANILPDVTPSWTHNSDLLLWLKQYGNQK